MGNYALANKIFWDVLLYMIPKDTLVSVLEHLVKLIAEYVYAHKEHEMFDSIADRDEEEQAEWEATLPETRYVGNEEV